MSEPSDGRGPREDEQKPHVRGWLRALLRGRDTTLRDAIEELIEEDETGTSIAADERVLLTNILKLRDRTVVDVMVPRADIVAIDIDTGLPELVARMAEEAHSRMPVYRGTLDDVVGMIHIKDVLSVVAGQRPFQIKDILREVPIVAPSMPVLDLLLQMRQNRQHMALVVDEFGGIDGLATIEDLVEEIVGEIEDEHDVDPSPHIVARPDGSFMGDARVSLDDFEAAVGRPLDDDDREDVDTLGGLVVALAGRVPARGELLRHPRGFEFEIVDADPRRVKRVRIRLLPEGEIAEHG